MILSVHLPQKVVTISEAQYRELLEDVYVNGLNKKKKQAQLTYDSSGSKRNSGNLSQDRLKTDKMNILNGDTYEVPLKGGIMSYNITSIKGKEVMHYFKHHFEKINQKTELSFKNENGQKELYELVMEDSELQRFVNDFKLKVKAVVDGKINDFTPLGDDGFSGISIYPVPSSSNFNIEMAKILEHTGFDGMKVQVINPNILKKDTSKLEKDLDFIDKNKEYYDHTYNDEVDYSHEDVLNTQMNKLVAHSHINDYIDELNSLSKALIKKYNARNKVKMPQSYIESLGDLYGRYVATYYQLIDSARYYSTIENKIMGRRSDKLIQAIKYSKGPSIAGRSIGIHKIALQSQSFYNSGYTITNPLDVCQWKTINFEIKKLGNDTRIGLKNYYQKNNSEEDAEMVQLEINKTKNTIVIIFDDNISGGATLSDICLQLKKIGIENIIPITFGEMHQQWRVGQTNIHQPENGFNMN